VNVAVLGSGSWGTALTLVLARNGHRVRLLGRNEEEVRTLRETGENPRYLPGFRVPAGVRFDLLDAPMDDPDLVVLAVPSGAIREVASRLRGLRAPVCVAAKGLERATGLRMTECVAEELPGWEAAVLSGPNLAAEIAAGGPSVAVSAARGREAAETVRDAFSCAAFRVSVSDDVTGVELSGALKNVLAIGAGVSDGLGFGDNTKAAFLSRGLMEMSRLGTAMGARAETFLGPAGAGDLFATAVSPLSRNHRLGALLGRGTSLDEATASLGQVAEGVPTSRTVAALASRHGVELPVFAAIEGVLSGCVAPRKAAELLMGRVVDTDDFRSG
jgi:glycerol-3-phosphate dehydrogenase (NAD(P)+)